MNNAAKDHNIEVAMLSKELDVTKREAKENSDANGSTQEAHFLG